MACMIIKISINNMQILDMHYKLALHESCMVVKHGERQFEKWLTFLDILEYSKSMNGREVHKSA